MNAAPAEPFGLLILREADPVGLVSDVWNSLTIGHSIGATGILTWADIPIQGTEHKARVFWVGGVEGEINQPATRLVGSPIRTSALVLRLHEGAGLSGLQLEEALAIAAVLVFGEGRELTTGGN